MMFCGLSKREKKIDNLENYKIDTKVKNIYKRHLNLLKKSEKKYFKFKKNYKKSKFDQYF